MFNFIFILGLVAICGVILLALSLLGVPTTWLYVLVAGWVTVVAFFFLSKPREDDYEGDSVLPEDMPPSPFKPEGVMRAPAHDST